MCVRAESVSEQRQSSAKQSRECVRVCESRERAEQCSAEQSLECQSRAEQSRAVQSSAEQSRAESVSEQSRAEQRVCACV